jgi:hypothetical protein
MWPRPLSQPFPNRRRGRSDSVPLSPATNGTAKRVETKGHGSDHNAAYFPSVMYRDVSTSSENTPDGFTENCLG